jgi:hypothetical protein
LSFGPSQMNTSNWSSGEMISRLPPKRSVRVIWSIFWFYSWYFEPELIRFKISKNSQKKHHKDFQRFKSLYNSKAPH